MAIDFGMNTPTQQESYERSRPQTPSASKEGNNSSNNSSHTNTILAPSATSPGHRQNFDTFMGGTSSRPHTRPASPFKPSFSVPTTPPDLYLVTRNSPNISQSLCENFQPDQLFPEASGMPAMPHTSPPQHHQSIDSNIMASFQNPDVPSSHIQQPQHQGQSGTFVSRSTNKLGMSGSSPLPAQNVVPPGMQHYQQQGPNNMWQPNFDGLLPDGQSPSDSWSTGSTHGQAVPTTLNVEDW